MTDKKLDAGLFIGNQKWLGIAGDPVKGTHNGRLDTEAHTRRTAKKARYLKNVETRREENKNRRNK
jgi:hypothetical protein